MRRCLIYIAISATLWLGAIAPVSATVPMGDQVATGLNGVGESIFQVPEAREGFVAKLILIVNYILTFLGVLFFLIILYAGWLWMFARGNTEDIEKAKKMFSEAVFGLVIIMTARIITEFILTQIGQVTSV
jgi:cbb3-type cytochrome oxidase subunit 3